MGLISNEFVVVEASRIEKDLPSKYQKALKELDAEAKAVAQKQLDFAAGGLFPSGDEYGRTPTRLNFFNLGTTNGTAETWNRNFANTGWNTFINNDTMDDVVTAVIGMQFPNVTQRIAAHQWSIAGKEQPVIQHEAELKSYKNPVLIYRRGMIIPKKTAVKLDVLIQGAGGYNIIKPEGWSLVSPEILTKKVPK